MNRIIMRIKIKIIKNQMINKTKIMKVVMKAKIRTKQIIQTINKTKIIKTLMIRTQITITLMIIKNRIKIRIRITMKQRIIMRIKTTMVIVVVEVITRKNKRIVMKRIIKKVVEMTRFRQKFQLFHLSSVFRLLLDVLHVHLAKI